MSLFFEDEIQKVIRKTDRSGLEKLISEDPRNQPGWSDRNRNRNNYSRQTFYRKNRHDPRNRPDGW
ncbi:chromosomal replication initiator protein dnaa [Bacillus sp. OxB-1]|uniref:hypothetical protein n=1 Tax=Bacillus sp. (strain OxB-1) TaxID=98228 RepID=UPI000581DBE3|nr:hypothetical protein [Bacillus sp. OxB-1]BAQ11814.1 chromosomal replication initiator protein dnaa [Bacillus sp. OxB-1]